MQKFNTVAMQKLLSRHCMHADILNQYDSYSYCVPHGHHGNGLFSLHCYPKIGQNRSSQCTPRSQLFLPLRYSNMGPE